MLVSETKLDDSFLLDGFPKPYRLDQGSNGGGILLFVKDDISSPLLTDLRLPDNVTMKTKTGISDFHKMVITVLNSFYNNKKTKIIHYRNYKTFNANLFKKELNKELLSIDDDNTDLVEFTNNVLSILDKYTPIKRKYIPANNSEFMIKDLRAAIMHRSEVRQTFLKERTNDSKHLCNRQRNLELT